MKVSEQFHKVRNHIGTTDLYIKHDSENKTTVLRLLIDAVNEITGEKYSTSIETETELSCSNHFGYGNSGKFNLVRLNVCNSIQHFAPCHVNTALKAIKKDSDVKIRAILFNDTHNDKNVGFSRHDFYLIVDNNAYLLQSYVGPNNSVSPVIFTVNKPQTETV